MEGRSTTHIDHRITQLPSRRRPRSESRKMKDKGKTRLHAEAKKVLHTAVQTTHVAQRPSQQRSPAVHNVARGSLSTKRPRMEGIYLIRALGFRLTLYSDLNPDEI